MRKPIHAITDSPPSYPGPRRNRRGGAKVKGNVFLTRLTPLDRGVSFIAVRSSG